MRIGQLTSQRIRQQKGATLIVALIFLMILTVVALSGMQSASTEIQTARRVKSQLDLFNAAEETLKIAEDWVESNGDPVDYFASLGNGIYVHSEIKNLVVNLDSVSALINSASLALSSATTSAPNTEGKFLVEYMGPLATPGSGTAGPTTRYLYRITAVGQQTGGGAQKIVQSYYVTSP